MGTPLTFDDEGVHAPGDQVNWNESRYIDFWDPVRQVGGWFRIGARPNARYAEMSACVYLPSGQVAFAFDRAEIAGNALSAAGRSGVQSWEIVEPWATSKVGFVGEMSVFDDGWVLNDPKRAFTTSPKLAADIDLTCTTAGGLGATMGQDQDQHHLVFLPGQADFHYQHMTHVTGTIRLGDVSYDVDGRGGKDHSWGPRNWHAKIFLRWLTCCVDDANGFMLTRSVGPTAERRSGFLLVDGEFRVVDGYEIANTYAGAPNYECRQVGVTVRAGDAEWHATGTPRNWLPARHRQTSPEGVETLLRIIKHPAEWSLADGRSATGHLEYHDVMVEGVPVGLHE
jgi:hypothetical protein